MASKLRARGTAVTALALVSGVTLAMTGSAGAATSQTPAYYNGVTSANMLGVAVNLPNALSGVLSALPVNQNLAVNLIGVTGNAVHNTVGTGAKTASTATATLASGSLVDALPAQLGLKKTVKATLAGPQSVADNARSINVDPLLDLNVGPLTATAKSTVNSASATLLNANIGKLGQLLGASAAGSQAVSQIQQLLKNVDLSGKVDSTVNQITQLLNGVTGGNSTVSSVTSQVQTAVNSVMSQVDSIVNNLTALQNLTVVKLDTIDANQKIAPAGSVAKAAAESKLVSLDVLDGLLTVKGFDSVAQAWANGIKGQAGTYFSTKQPIATIGTPILTATLNQNGLSLSNVTGLPSSITDQVNSLLQTLTSELNSLLNILVVHLNYVEGTGHASADGKFATATGPEYDIVVDNPISTSAKDKALVVIGLGHGTTASVSAAQATRHVTVPNQQLHSLPHTGANLPLIAGGGLALLIGAAVLRRRVMV